MVLHCLWTTVEENFLRCPEGEPGETGRQPADNMWAGHRHEPPPAAAEAESVRRLCLRWVLSHRKYLVTGVSTGPGGPPPGAIGDPRHPSRTVTRVPFEHSTAERPSGPPDTATPASPVGDAGVVQAADGRSAGRSASR